MRRKAPPDREDEEQALIEPTTLANPFPATPITPSREHRAAGAEREWTDPGRRPLSIYP
jgi:hypothetical protein